MNNNNKESIQDIIENYRLSLGRDSGGCVELLAVDKGSELLEKPKELEDFRVISIEESAFDFVEFIFREVSEDESFWKYGIYFFDEKKLHLLIERLAKFNIEIEACESLNSFCSVISETTIRGTAEYIQKYYSETWEYLRFSIRLVLIQLCEFFELCIKMKKSVWMLGI
jgi:hypothetical protein